MEDFKAWLRSITVPMWISCAMVIATALYVLVRAARSDDPLLLLLALTGGLIGWVVGILATPLSDAEDQRFGELAKVRRPKRRPRAADGASLEAERRSISTRSHRKSAVRRDARLCRDPCESAEFGSCAT